MHFSSYALLSLCGTVLAEGIIFDPFLKPEHGDVLQAGSVYQIKWTSTTAKPVKLTLHDQKSNGDEKDATVIKDNIPSKEAQYNWNVDGNISSSNQLWYIKLALADNPETFSYSPGFKIHSNSSSSSNTSSMTTTGSSMTATGSPTSTGSPSSSTSSAGGNVATSAPLVFVGAAAFGALVL